MHFLNVFSNLGLSENVRKLGRYVLYRIYLIDSILKLSLKKKQSRMCLICSASRSYKDIFWVLFGYPLEQGQPVPRIFF